MKERTVAETVNFLRQCKPDEVVRTDEAGNIYVEHENGYTRSISSNGKTYEIRRRA